MVRENVKHMIKRYTAHQYQMISRSESQNC